MHHWINYIHNERGYVEKHFCVKQVTFYPSLNYIVVNLFMYINTRSLCRSFLNFDLKVSLYNILCAWSLEKLRVMLKNINCCLASIFLHFKLLTYWFTWVVSAFKPKRRNTEPISWQKWLFFFSLVYQICVAHMGECFSLSSVIAFPVKIIQRKLQG